MAGRFGPRRLISIAATLAAILIAPAAAGAQDYQFVRAFGGNGPGPGEFSLPLGVTAAPDGTIYVADTFNNRIQSFDADGGPLAVIGGEGTGDGRFNAPFDVELDEQGNLLVADTGNRRIQRIDPATGSMLQAFGELGRGPDQLAAPTGVAADGAGGTFVVDRDNRHVHHYDAGGALIDRWGSSGSGPGEFTMPLDITVGSEGVYVADAGNDRIQRFTPAGEFASEWGGLSIPQGIDRDPADRVFVADSGNNRVRLFDPFGSPLTMWGMAGSGAGEFDLPKGIAADCAGRIYVTDAFNNRVQVFADLDAEPDPGACGLTIEDLIERARELDLPGRSEMRIVIRLRFAAWMLERDDLRRACHAMGTASQMLDWIGRSRYASPEAELLRADLGRFMLDVGCDEQPRPDRGHGHHKHRKHR